jgi:transposase
MHRQYGVLEGPSTPNAVQTRARGVQNDGYPPTVLIELARAGRKIEQLAREFEPSANAIRKWIKQAALDEGLRSDGLSASEREELNRLRRENRILREEREILSKAAAWFAQETAPTPLRRSNS